MAEQTVLSNTKISLSSASMSDPSALPLLHFFVAFLLLCILSFAFLKKRYSRLRLPPGPPGLPILGHLHKLSLDPHKSLQSLSRTYGPLLFLKFGSLPVIVVSSPEMAKNILQKQDQNFAWRSPFVVHRVLHKYPTIAGSQPDPAWRSIRQICATQLFAPTKLKSFQPIILEEIRSLLRSIDADGHQKSCVRSKLHAASINIISRMTLGNKLQMNESNSAANASAHLTNLLVESIELSGFFNLSDYVPWLAWMDLQGCERKSKALGGKLQKVWTEIIDERRQYRNIVCPEREDTDFLDILLSAFEIKDPPLEYEKIAPILYDIFAGGTDTSAITVEWALAELISHPSKMKRVQDEIDEVVGNSRLVEPEDVQNMPYFQAVIKETMRLHPLLPFLVPHMAKAECRVEDFDIPANALTLINVWAIGRDEKVWGSALDFSPERFLGSDIDVRGRHFELLPFGSGRRACPGMLLGIINVNLMLACLRQAFVFEPNERLDKTEKFGIVMALANPLLIRASPRVPIHLLLE
ncbi:hypothetical protein KP509_01G031700 [Ceratopteris richardii]|uniref:Cytochrome P450 n=3 Tax=Ceratopteris richardii TaxID=49495 RepID=A0A8T2VK39_CERRI|nr:hypothetical protein KP509_01G031700 [Ceratopteris richardii]